jgi:hypothetical protein
MRQLAWRILPDLKAYLDVAYNQIIVYLVWQMSRFETPYLVWQMSRFETPYFDIEQFIDDLARFSLSHSE